MQLFNDLLAEIEIVPAADIHSLVAVEAPCAANLAELVVTPRMEAVLRSAGAPNEAFESNDPARKVAILAPHFERIRNTTPYWLLSQILADLFERGPLHECDPDDIARAVASAAAQDGRADFVLESANIDHVLCASPWSHKPGPREGRFAPLMRVDSLIIESHQQKTLDRLTETTGQNIYEAADLKKAVDELFASAASAGVKGVSATLNPQIDFEEASREGADRILSLVLLGQRINREDRKSLRSYALDLILRACSEHAMPFQLMAGAKTGVAGDRMICGWEPQMAANYAEVVSRHPKTRIDIIPATEESAREFAVLGAAYRNVFVSGQWFHAGVPSTIRRILRERIAILPQTKSCAFFSDAPCVEWVYAGCRLIRRELALALAKMVTESYLTEGQALEVARYWLYENPKRMYGID